jgi:hypothetical protein
MSHGFPWLQPIKSTCGGGNRRSVRVSLTANYPKSRAILYRWEEGIKVKRDAGAGNRPSCSQFPHDKTVVARCAQ